MLRKVAAALKRVTLPFQINRDINSKLVKLMEEREAHSNQFISNLEELKVEETKLVNFFEENSEDKEDEVIKHSFNEFKMKPFEVDVLNFKKDPKQLDLVEMSIDDIYGGNSECFYSFCEETQSAHFTGILDTERLEGMLRTPFCEYKFAFHQQIQASDCHGLRMRILKDSDLALSVIVKGPTTMEFKGNLMGVVKHSGQEWVDIDLPISHLLEEGMDLKKEYFFNQETSLFKFGELNFLCESKKKKMFEFRIQKISLFYDPELKKVEKSQKKTPYFFHSFKDYSEYNNEPLDYGEVAFKMFEE